MMKPDHQLAQQLKALRLGGFLETLELRLKQVQQEELSPLIFLQLIVQDELERREARKLSRRISKACFEEEKSFEGFDFAFNPKIKRALIKELATCLYLEKKRGQRVKGKGEREETLPFALCPLPSFPLGDTMSSSSRQPRCCARCWQLGPITLGRSGSRGF